ncbi:hypothetical protein B0A48_06948 [Cryoendolithus antarcticus]|uniref:Prokaryotic-type class I peptide chain release factors domain-containing protein n=1 Tax=Cryoendolithus antarcticus TaxID=1507870 RepID=A0A1V8TA59_9PEZI|nr:hypothetical protein B0A48_06948 [Cryoendolithus antarcticus]
MHRLSRLLALQPCRRNFAPALRVPLSATLSATSSRALASKDGPQTPLPDADPQVAAARSFLSTLSPATIPRSLCTLTFSRSSGPGGQNVNKISSKATLRLPLSSLLPLLPSLLHVALRSSSYLAPASGDLVISSDASRKQADNVENCYRKLYQLVEGVGRDVVPGETSVEQREKVVRLQKAEAVGRRKLKEFQGKKKAARRGGVRGDD